MPADHAEEPLRAGVEHLQAAAREMIAASRSMLDAAEELVDDPKAVQSLVASLGALATAAAAKLRSESAACGGSAESADGDRDSGVERIHLS